jgi:hypothetical protein
MTTRNSRNAAIAAAALLAASAGAATAQECYADCDGSGELDFFDFLCYQNLFTSGVIEADCDGSGELDFFDFLCFQEEFAAGCPAGDVIEAELGCTKIPGYPHVDYVQAYGPDEVIYIGIDPSIHGAIGEADVYVTEAKTAAEWAADPTLTDVRPGGAQFILFPGGASVTENLFILDGSDQLAVDPPTEEIGWVFHIVVDTNRNGQLDAGDLIDGPGAGGGIVKFKDLTTLGPVPTTRVDTYTATFPGIISTRNQQRLTYPSDIAARTDVPLVVIAHGNGQDYRWYDYIHDLFASHGWVVMSHENNTGPGIEAASETQLRHPDFFLGNLDTIAGGVLEGRIDKSKMVWIGHSRGGEGVARSFTKLATGVYNPINYEPGDIILGSSIAPTDFLGTSGSNPGDYHYHHIAGSADGDVHGGASNPIAQYFSIYERARQRRVNTYIHGADHNDFNCCGFNDFRGPPGTEIGRPEAQQAAMVVWHALIQDVVRGNPAALEYVQRQQENSRPAGVKPETIVDHEYKYHDKKFVIDDFQSNPATGVSSSGGVVSFSVNNLVEDRLDDGNTDFTWTPADPMNGMTRGSRATDQTRGIVFDYQGDANIEFVVDGADFTVWRFLSWRACQGTRHPDTTFFLGEQAYEVTITDGMSNTSTIRIDSYGAGHEELYQRTGEGAGAGWGNEFETIRIRTTDFARDGGNGIDLTDIRSIRFEFGPSHGTARGRVGFDDLELTSN